MPTINHPRCATSRSDLTQGFNVIQTVLVNVDIPANAAGHVPFVDGDFSRPRVVAGPDNDFWDDADWFVDQAAAHGMYLALLPTWNSSVPEDHPMVKDPAIAYRYGHFLGSRYRDRTQHHLGAGRRPATTAGRWRSRTAGHDPSDGRGVG